MTEYDLGKVVGDDGEAGNGIASITKTGTSGLVDTYTITYDDGTTTTFTVTNGSNASVTIQTSWGSTTSDSKVPSEKLTKDTLDTKIAKSSTTGLVKNDGTIMTSGTGSTNYSAGNHTHSGYISTSSTSGLIKNDGSIMTGGTGSSNWAIGNHTHSGYVSGSKVTSWSSTVSDSNIPSEKLVKNSLDDKIGKSSTSGLVKNDGTIDTSAYITSSALSNYMQKSSTSGLMKNDGTVDTNSYLTTGTASSTYQPKLTSGTNIKTINNESLLGSGNITIQGGSSVDVVTSWEATLSDTKVPSEKLVKNTIDGLSIPTKTSDLTNDGDGTNVFVKNNDSRLTDSRTPTSHTHGNLTNDGKVGSNANYIVVTGTGGAITSVQKLGNITYDGKIGSTSGKPIITTTSGVLTTGSFGTSSGTFAEGNHTHSGYISTSSTTGLIKNDGTIMTSGTGSTNYSAGNHTHSGYVSTSDIADNLTTNDSTKVLSAKQGKALNDLIGAAISYINQ